jgi:phage/plasmid-like protein (TIGR03299 family)
METMMDFNQARGALYTTGRGFPALRSVRPEEAMDSEAMLSEAGLDWGIEQLPVYAKTREGMRRIPGRVANVRTDTRDALGVVGKGYTPLQNRDAFAFTDELVQSGKAGWIGAAQYGGGAVVSGLMMLNRDITIAGIEDERVLPLIAFRNGHDGGTGVSVTVAPFRLACLNGMILPITGATRVWRARHTSGITKRIDEARRTLELSWSYYDELEEMGRRLVAKRMSEKRFADFMNRLVPLTPRMEADPGGRSAASREAAIQAVTEIFRNGDDLANVRGTEWAALQAVAEYDSWGRNVRNTERSSADENRLARATKPSLLKDRAVALLTA